MLSAVSCFVGFSFPKNTSADIAFLPQTRSLLGKWMDGPLRGVAWPTLQCLGFGPELEINGILPTKAGLHCSLRCYKAESEKLTMPPWLSLTFSHSHPCLLMAEFLFGRAIISDILWWEEQALAPFPPSLASTGSRYLSALQERDKSAMEVLHNCLFLREPEELLSDCFDEGGRGVARLEVFSGAGVVAEPWALVVAVWQLNRRCWGLTGWSPRHLEYWWGGIFLMSRRMCLGKGTELHFSFCLRSTGKKQANKKKAESFSWIWNIKLEAWNCLFGRNAHTVLIWCWSFRAALQGCC